MNKRLIILVSVVIALIAGGVFGMKVWQNYQAAEYSKKGASNQELLGVIVRDKPSLTYKNAPFVKIGSVKRIDDVWYIVTIQSVKNDNTEVPVRVLVHDTRTGSEKRKLKVTLGPENHFTEYQLFKSGLPDSVIKELRS